MNYQDISIIQKLYWSQTAQIDLDGELLEKILIEIGLRQESVQTELHFSIYTEAIFEEYRIIINRKVISILANITEERQRLLHQQYLQNHEFKMRRKTRYIVKQ